MSRPFQPIWLLHAAVILAALASVPLTVAQLEGEDTPLMEAADWVIWTIFVVDFLVMLTLARRRGEHLRRSWFSAALVVLTYPGMPTLLQGLRIARVARLLRLLRLVAITSRALNALGSIFGRRGLVYVAAITAFIVISGAGALAVLEPETVRGDYWTGLWWAVVTSTTVGYGDVSPVSLPGRLVALVIMLTGIGLVSTIAGSVTAYFVSHEENAELRDIRNRLERIEQLMRAQHEPR